MPKGATGFKKLIGATITAVDASAVNQVKLTTSDNRVLVIDAVVVDSIPKMKLTEEKPRKHKFTYIWPYPVAPMKEKDK